MADTDNSQKDTGTPPAAPVTTMSLVAPALGWLIPGAGHLAQKCWVRGGLIMASVVAMFWFGLAMNGKVYPPNTGDLLDILGFVGDLGAGGLYILGRINEWGDTAIRVATADYGTKYIVVAGLLNVMSAVDAYHIAIGKKP